MNVLDTINYYVDPTIGNYSPSTCRYQVLKSLGRGAFGVVYLGENIETKALVAIKRVKLSFTKLRRAKDIVREVSLMRVMNHPNILKLYEILAPQSYKDFDDVYLVCEVMEMDLKWLLNSGQVLQEQHYQHFAYQICCGLNYMHSIGLIHRDLKPSNVLLKTDCDLKLCDFGLARDGNYGKYTEYMVTRWYRAPEILLECEYGTASDMWSFGCLLGELLLGRPLFPGNNAVDQIQTILKVFGTPESEDSDWLFITNPKGRQYMKKQPRFPETTFLEVFPNVSIGALNLLQKLLNWDPNKRLSARDTLYHPYFSQIPKNPILSEDPKFKVNSLLKIENLSIEELKLITYKEMCLYHPEMKNANDLPYK